MSLAKGLSIYANGVNLATALQSFSPQTEAEELDATVLAHTSRSYEQGFKTASAQGAGVFRYDQTNLDEMHNILSAAFTTGSSVIVTGSPEVLTVGSPAYLMDAIESEYSINTPLGQLITVSTTVRSNNGLNFGEWLFSAAVDDTTTNGASQDNGAATSNGGLFHVHVQNPDEISGDDVILQHSDDDSIWVDLATVTLTGAANEALSATVAAGTTVERYVRVSATATGGEITFQAAFARR